LELVRYIHLNPLRAKQVATLKGLDRYRYSGHSGLMGHRGNDWQAIDAVLRVFGKSLSMARRQYRLFVEQGIALGRMLMIGAIEPVEPHNKRASIF
jgi:putative transposase